MEQYGESFHLVPLNTIDRALGHYDLGCGLQTLTEILSASKGKVVVSEVMDSQAEVSLPKGMDWLDYDWSQPHF